MFKPQKIISVGIESPINVIILNRQIFSNNFYEVIDRFQVFRIFFLSLLEAFHLEANNALCPPKIICEQLIKYIFLSCRLSPWRHASKEKFIKRSIEMLPNVKNFTPGSYLLLRFQKFTRVCFRYQLLPGPGVHWIFFCPEYEVHVVTWCFMREEEDEIVIQLVSSL